MKRERKEKESKDLATTKDEKEGHYHHYYLDEWIGRQLQRTNNKEEDEHHILVALEHDMQWRSNLRLYLEPIQELGPLEFHKCNRERAEREDAEQEEEVVEIKQEVGHPR